MLVPRVVVLVLVVAVDASATLPNGCVGVSLRCVPPPQVVVCWVLTCCGLGAASHGAASIHTNVRRTRAHAATRRTHTDMLCASVRGLCVQAGQIRVMANVDGTRHSPTIKVSLKCYSLQSRGFGAQRCSVGVSQPLFVAVRALCARTLLEPCCENADGTRDLAHGTPTPNINA